MISPLQEKFTLSAVPGVIFGIIMTLEKWYKIQNNKKKIIANKIKQNTSQQIYIPRTEFYL